jgi:hypothetical protein
MVDHIRPTERVGAILTPARPRKVKRDQNRRDQRQRETDEEKAGADTDGREGSPGTAQKGATDTPRPAGGKPATRGQRINVVI